MSARTAPQIIVAVTGTPGTGKTAACAFLRGYTVISVRELVEENAGMFERDPERDTLEVDPEVLRRQIPEIEGIMVLEGHLSHLLDPDITIVLRCNPQVLAERLFSRPWPPQKIRENQEAEAVDVIMIEAMEKSDLVFEIDTSELSPREVAAAIDSIIRGERGKYEPGNIDWSEEVLDWY